MQKAKERGDTTLALLAGMVAFFLGFMIYFTTARSKEKKT